MSEQDAPYNPTEHFIKLHYDFMRAILDPEAKSDQRQFAICTVISFLAGTNKNPPPDSTATAKEE